MIYNSWCYFYTVRKMKGENVGFSALKCTTAAPMPRSQVPHGVFVYSLAYSQAAGRTSAGTLPPNSAAHANVPGLL